MAENFLVLPPPQRTAFGRRRPRFKLNRPSLGDQFVRSLLGGVSNEFAAERDFTRQMALLGLGQEFQGEQRGLDRDESGEERDALFANQKQLSDANLTQLVELLGGQRNQQSDLLSSLERRSTEQTGALREEFGLRDAQQTAALGEATAARVAQFGAFNNRLDLERDVADSREREAKFFRDIALKDRQLERFGASLGNQADASGAADLKRSNRNSSVFENELRNFQTLQDRVLNDPSDSSITSYQRAVTSRFNTLAKRIADADRDPTDDERIQLLAISRAADAGQGLVPTSASLKQIGSSAFRTFGSLPLQVLHALGKDTPLGRGIGTNDELIRNLSSVAQQSRQLAGPGVEGLIAPDPEAGLIGALRELPENQAAIEAISGGDVGAGPEVFGLPKPVAPDGSEISFQAPGGEDEELLRRLLSGQGTDLLGLNGGFA